MSLASAMTMLMFAVAFGTAENAHAAASRTADSMEGTVRIDHCSWDHPGGNPFMGSVVDALDRYTDMPSDVRARLKEKMAARQYDDIASITRTGISGKEAYDPEIREMHFGTNRVCKTVSRSGWSKTREERGLVYCDKTECIIVPTVCRNVSRVTRRGGEPLAAGDLFPTAGAAPAGDELAFAPPGAGPIGAPGGSPAVGDLGGVPGPMASAGMFGGALPWLFGPVAGAVLGGGSNGELSHPDLSNQTIDGTGVLVSSGTPGFTPAVPEPGTWLLLSLGLIGLVVSARSSSARDRR